MALQQTVEKTVAGLGYDLVEIERSAGGLLRVTIDLPWNGPISAGAPEPFVTVEDCEKVTRQLQFALEVDGVDYKRLEVSSPGIDRPLRNAQDFERFVGEVIDITLKAPMGAAAGGQVAANRKKFRGTLERVAGADGAVGWQIVWSDEPLPKPGQKVSKKRVPAPLQALGFALDELREARLAPIVDFKGRRPKPGTRPGFRGWFRKGEFVAVQRADFSIAPGETLGVVGESGSGKSTLALAALGLLRHQGELDVAGRRWNSGGASDRALRRAMQVVFQDPFSSLSPRMTVEQIVGEGLTVHAPELGAAERRARSLDVLAQVGLTEAQFPALLDRYPHEFSGGQRQRLAVARALIVDPRLLVLDEPTSALDVTIQKQVLGLLQRLQRERGLSYLLITHDVEVIRAMAHQVIVMKDGAILESGPVERVLDAPEHPYTQNLVAASLVD